MLRIQEIFAIRTFRDEAEEYGTVLIAEVEPTKASAILNQLSLELPLQRFELAHLKRIRRSSRICEGKAIKTLELIICPPDALTTVTVLIPEGVGELKPTRVPLYAPTTVAEFEKWGELWPVIFRPNELDKDRSRGHSKKEIDLIARYMDAVQLDTDQMIELGHCHPHGAVIVNPAVDQIVVSASDSLKYHLIARGHSALMHPLLTPTMLCEEGVAAVIRGEMQPYSDTRHLSSVELLPEDPYLCSGFHLYLDYEPDLMSAMSLVHSRIARVFFRRRAPINGALVSTLQMHSITSLNHHFRVFEVICSEKSEDRECKDVSLGAKEH